ncbi:MAG: hypothetical protein QF682_11815 [Candidatus Thermoplasmatota archaeon]|nr:hypothetical protein [Candidatus Thermoplasmatota archaeon]
MGRNSNIRLVVPNKFRIRRLICLSICFCVIFFSLLTGGCLKKTVGRWDSGSVGDLIIVEWRKNSTRLEVDIIMTNNNFTKLPIQSVYFNIYDTDNNIHACSWTNYSSHSETVKIVYNETYYISLVFGRFYESNITTTPDLLEYRYPNNNKRVKFGQYDENGILIDSFSLLLIGVGIVIIAIIIIVILKKKKKNFMG